MSGSPDNMSAFEPKEDDGYREPTEPKPAPVEGETKKPEAIRKTLLDAVDEYERRVESASLASPLVPLCDVIQVIEAAFQQLMNEYPAITGQLIAIGFKITDALREKWGK